MIKKVLIIGASGYLGSEVIKNAPGYFELYLGYWSNPIRSVDYKTVKIDLLDHQSLEREFNRIKPDIIIYTARMEGLNNDLAKAEELAIKFISLVKYIKARLIYMSSDAVFDGKKGDYKEDDLTNPITNYGRSKLLAENLIKQELGNYVIIRTGYIYGKWDKRKKQLIEETKNGKTIERFDDMYRTIINVTNLSQYIWELVESDYTGIIHFGEKKQSVYQFSQFLLENAGLDPKLVSPISLTEKYSNIAPDTSLDTRLASKLTELHL